ncbi:hypothetical protein Nepgr_032224 [Nepenthes gracilis]|uniref:Uncharacterized protein n=1 Tax=Nepenthes gracilis TaxID=150966 RepID=A0AAD3TJX4_NEPGR|nr:hypothetical protein Nepgr_032224 [Nepenthes gracilis]
MKAAEPRPRSGTRSIRIASDFDNPLGPVSAPHSRIEELIPRTQYPPPQEALCASPPLIQTFLSWHLLEAGCLDRLRICCCDVADVAIYRLHMPILACGDYRFGLRLDRLTDVDSPAGSAGG